MCLEGTSNSRCPELNTLFSNTKNMFLILYSVTQRQILLSNSVPNPESQESHLSSPSLSSLVLISCSILPLKYYCLLYGGCEPRHWNQISMISLADCIILNVSYLTSHFSIKWGRTYFIGHCE